MSLDRPPLESADSTWTLSADALLQSSVDAVLVMNADGRLAKVNRAAEQLFGYRREEMVGRELASLIIPPAQRDAHRAALAHYLSTGESRILQRRVELTALRADGTECPVELTASVIEGTLPPRFIGFVRDVSARVRAEQELIESRERYRFLADSIPTQVWTAGADGRIEYINARAAAYFAEDASAVAENYWHQRVFVDDRAACAAAWTRALETGEPFEAEFRLTGADGVPRWFIGRARPLRIGPRVIRWFGTSTNIQDAKEAQIALQERAAELAHLAAALADSNRELDQFAYVASHDLKAPLRGIANLATWIEEDMGSDLPASARGHLELLRGRVQRMEGLIEGILQYSRAGRSSVAPERVDTGTLVREVAELAAISDAVSVEIDPSLPVVNTERLPLQQVFLNLITNAVKYNTNARPVVRVSWRPTPEGPEFSVEDNGPGIAPRYHQRIWGIFQTLESRDKVEGTGIGLSLVKKIVESRGGRAWVESEEGAGATFRFTWPPQRLAASR